MFLAKREPQQSYRGHIECVYKAWQQLIQAHAHMIEQVCSSLGIPVERFLKSSLLTVALHDTGKLTGGFQAMMNAPEERVRQVAMQQNYRHELASVPFVLYAAHLLNQQEGVLLEKAPSLEVLAVAGHHKRVTSGLESFERERIERTRLSWEEGGIEHAFELLQSLFAQEGWSFPEPTHSQLTHLKQKDPHKVLNTIVSDLQRKWCEDTATNMTILFNMMKGLLMDADWHGSAKIPQARTVVPSTLCQDDVHQYLTKKASLEGWAFQRFRDFQRDAGDIHGHAIAIAPTGSGKTEASMLWSLRQIQEGAVGKVFYLLPTMVTATALWERMVQFFQPHGVSVGLTHSLAELLRDGESETWENRSSVLFEKSFITPVVVATIDQLLTVILQRGKWSLKMFNAADAAIVIDEVHAYDSYTLGLLYATMKYLEPLGSRFFLMSATMPEKLIKGFQKTLQEPVHLLKDRELLGSVRNRYETSTQKIEDSLHEVRPFLAEGKRVLIVVNTVRQAQDIARELKELNPICYHSKFILDDRRKIETRILEDHSVKLVIATQVVEVSLDIDFDVMLTECAPPDALAQRAGRINRRRSANTGLIRIYRPGFLSHKIYELPEEQGQTNFLWRTFRAFEELTSPPSEEKLIEIVDRIYEEHDPWAQEDFAHSLNLIKDLTSKHWLLDHPLKESVDTRLERYAQVPVIPLQFSDLLHNCPPKERHRYELKMPLWYVQKYGVKDETTYSFEIMLCDMEYDSQLGGRFLDEDVSSTVF